ncbi:aminoglycoside phosphotransferase [Sphingomonas spermidinifaciens]|uniref:Aminoglycoside phosphotransferase n=1 Tax=Sphingomonas spermidinifaciens TaxID=1141889 RepID=A0A2A4B3B7_9SPHN|nr:AAA family ATPase [Sphingomonas spermidinifaciens]PCD02228.1 aminoglycoside phosphotransferase [Sphingomonas spermidinifaciens]
MPPNLRPAPRNAEPVQAEILRFLASPDGLATAGPCRRIDTHAATVFLAGDRAWKLKRAVRYAYLDFSTPELRRAALEAELLLNRRTAPGLYRAVLPVVRVDETLAIGGEGPAVDWILEMERFPDGALLDELADAGALDPGLMQGLADRIHGFHEHAERVVVRDGAMRFGNVIEGNAESLAPFAGVLGEARIAALLQAQRASWKRHSGLLDERGRKGFVRHAHGDLHLANVALVEGEPTPFDCLEFSVELATIDTLYDLAFLLMDLWHRNLRTEANLVFNRYVDRSADENGVRLLPLFLSVRATIRAHVLTATAARSGAAEQTREAEAFLSLAAELIAPVRPRLVTVAGLSGTGKSAVSRSLGAELGAAPGARILRSDVLRKRLAQVPPEQKLPASLYSPLASRVVYTLLANLAGRHLAQGTAVIADAVAATPEQRDAIAHAAVHAHVSFVGLWLEASEDVRLDRVCARQADASDANAVVVVAQSDDYVPPPADWRRLPAAQPLADVVALARRAIGA